MVKCNSTETDIDNGMNEILVDNLPDDVIELRYYVEGNTIHIIQPHRYFIKDMCLYSRYGTQYYRYDLEPIRYMRIPLRLSDNSIELAEIELLLDTNYQEQKYIDQLMPYVYTRDDSRMYFDKTDETTDYEDDDDTRRLRHYAYQEHLGRVSQQSNVERNNKANLLQRAYRRGNRQILNHLTTRDIERMDEDELEKMLLEG